MAKVRTKITFFRELILERVSVNVAENIAEISVVTYEAYLNWRLEGNLRRIGLHFLLFYGRFREVYIIIILNRRNQKNPAKNIIGPVNLGILA